MIAPHRLSLPARIAAASLGAYGLTALIVMLLSRILMLAGMVRAEAVLAATLPAFLIDAVLVCAIIHARSARRAWVWLGGVSLPMAALLWAMMQGTAV